MKYEPVLTEELWASLERRRVRRERLAKFFVCVVFPLGIAALVHYSL